MPAPRARAASMNSLLGQCDRLGIDDAGDLHPIHQRDDEHDDDEAGLQDGGEGDGEQKRRERHHQIREAHDGGADETAQEAGDHSEPGAEHHGGAVGEHADDHRSLGTEQEAGEDVAAERVGAHPEAGVGGQRLALDRQPVEELLVRIVGGDEVRRDGRQHRNRHDDEAAERRPVFGKSSPEVAHEDWEQALRLPRGPTSAQTSTNGNQVKDGFR